MHQIGRKRRTREHVIADLSVNHVERMILRCGHTMERFWHDYGFDLLLFTYDNDGEYQNGNVRLQVKATDHLERRSEGDLITWRVETAHMRHWLDEPMPVILIVYDARQDKAYWLYVQQIFENRRGSILKPPRSSILVKVPAKNVLNEEAVNEFAGFRDRILTQSRGVIRHHD